MAAGTPTRVPEPFETMEGLEQVRSYVKAYEWGGPTSALQLHHLRELSLMIRPGDTVLDLACGPGPLLLELAGIYGTAQFIGVDLSSTMLEYLEQEAVSRNANNVSVIQEDVRTLPSLAAGSIDLVITTSALHHLPDEQSLRQLFRRVRSLVKSDGGFYMFDFGLLKSTEARGLFVAEVAKRAPPLTAHDYELSLGAAFPITSALRIAEEELPRPFVAWRSAFVDFCYFLQSPPRARRSPAAEKRLRQVWSGLPLELRMEHVMLRWLRRRRRFD